MQPYIHTYIPWHDMTWHVLTLHYIRVPYIHTYMHTCIRTYVHTYIHNYITLHHIIMHYTTLHTYIHACMHACIHTYRHTYIHPYISLPYLTLHYIHYIRLHFITLHSIHAWLHTLNLSLSKLVPALLLFPLPKRDFIQQNLCKLQLNRFDLDPSRLPPEWFHTSVQHQKKLDWEDWASQIVCGFGPWVVVQFWLGSYN